MWKMSNVYYNKYVHPKVFFKKLDLMKNQCQKSVEKYSCKNFVTNINQLIKV